MAKEENAIKEAIENLDIEGEESEDIRKALETLASNMFEQGLLPKEAMGLSDDMVEGLYSFAYRLYNTGKYDQATQLFRLLILLDPTCSKFLLGLAACFHMQKEYEIAATSYILCTLVDPNNPIPYYHASDCYIQLDKADLAIAALEVCLKKMGDKEEFAAIRDRVQVALETVREKIKQGEEKPLKVKKTKKKAA